jgi:hypothetical protein
MSLETNEISNTLCGSTQMKYCFEIKILDYRLNNMNTVFLLPTRGRAQMGPVIRGKTGEAFLFHT